MTRVENINGSKKWKLKCSVVIKLEFWMQIKFYWFLQRQTLFIHSFFSSSFINLFWHNINCAQKKEKSGKYIRKENVNLEFILLALSYIEPVHGWANWSSLCQCWTVLVFRSKCYAHVLTFHCYSDNQNRIIDYCILHSMHCYCW